MDAVLLSKFTLLVIRINLLAFSIHNTGESYAVPVHQPFMSGEYTCLGTQPLSKITPKYMKWLIPLYEVWLQNNQTDTFLNYHLL